MKKVTFIENLMIRSSKSNNQYVEVYPKGTELHLDDNVSIVRLSIDGVKRPFNIHDLKRSGIVKIEKIGNDFTT